MSIATRQFEDKTRESEQSAAFKKTWVFPGITVSTIYRPYETMEGVSWGYETLVFDAKKEMVGQEYDRNHDEIVRSIIELGEYKPKEGGE